MRTGARLLACAASAFAMAAAFAGGLGAGDASGASAANRYSLANGCFALRSDGGDYIVKDGDRYRASASSRPGAESFRMKATDLGSYLLYGEAGDFLAADALERVTPGSAPSDRADWIVRERSGGGFTLSNHGAGKSLAVSGGGTLVLASQPDVFRFETKKGCRGYPEIGVDAAGTPTKGSNANGEVSGLVDAHMHHMAFEFLGGRAHCGRPWHRFGAPSALQDCIDHEPNGAGAILENTVSYGNPAGTHDTDGWPSFEGWPHHASLTHEQSYYKWLERAHRGGLRIFVNLLVENEVLCELYPLKQNSCNEMDSARLQAKRMHQLEDYIDAQSGGPGKGWFRIVRDPFKARRVINDGKLAVVMGMETSKPFDCGRLNGQPTCTREQINRQIDQFHDLGVRQLELVNKFDNAFTGVAGDSGSTGTITNTGNFYDTGRFWDLETCEPPKHDPRYHDHTPTAVHYHNEDALIANGLEALLPPGAAPVYPPPPNCNTLGLSDLGKHALQRVMDKGMIFDPDHMSVRARNAALDVVENRGYSGIISSHSWSTKDALPRIYALGGMVTPYAGSSTDFVAKWRETRKFFRGMWTFGFGYGADMNGFGSQGGPRGAGASNPVTYPFRSYDGKVTLSKQRSGSRTWDINTDGVAHYGLYPDWIEDIRKVAGADGGKLMKEMGRGAEAYLQMWERAEGVRGVRCPVVKSDFTSAGLGDRIGLGDSQERLLERAGQPTGRTATGWQWCARRDRQAEPQQRGLGAAFGGSETVALVLSALPRTEARGIGPGTPAGELRGKARRIGPDLWVRDAGSDGARFVYVVREGAVRFVGVGTQAVTGDDKALARYVARSGVR